ncbi:MAG TPA: pyridoxamine 5'-phosphate oxidase, partial [bacterium]|nr:pyridoxamine 5'-phosphate oxidase [bacterium]
FRRQDLHEDPLEQFRLWYAEARGCGLREPDAMALATVDEQGHPSVRTVLLRGLRPDGFVFYTNHESAKGRHLRKRPQASLCFHWEPLRRAVRVAGGVLPLSREESEPYFQSRPRSSQVAAWSSPQSRVIASREVMEQAVQEAERKFEGQAALPCPPFWGGYLVTPQTIEFWVSQPSRLHDRLRYRREAGGGWLVERLSP